MKTLFLVAALIVALTPDGVEARRGIRGTYAVRYAPGVMSRVARVRHLPIVKYMASVPNCSMIGKWVKANVNGHVRWFRVTDCSAPKDRARHIRSGLVIEVNHTAAVELFPRGAGRTSAYIIMFASSPELEE